MFPVSSAQNMIYGAFAHVIHLCYYPYRDFFFTKSSYLKNVGSIEFCLKMLLSTWPCFWVDSRRISVALNSSTMIFLVSYIYLRRNPLKVINCIILFISIKMCGLQPYWTFSHKSEKYNPVNRKRLSIPILTCNERIVSLIVWGSRKNFMGVPLMERFYSSSIRYFIQSFISDNWTPFLIHTFSPSLNIRQWLCGLTQKLGALFPWIIFSGEVSAYRKG